MDGVLGTINEVRGHTHDWLYDLVVATDRIVAVNVWHPLDTSTRVSMGTWLVGRALTRREEDAKRKRHVEERRSHYTELDLDRLSESDQRRFVIWYSELEAVEVRGKRLSGFIDLLLTTASLRDGRRTRYTMPSRQVEHARELLAAAVPAKLRN